MGVFTRYQINNYNVWRNDNSLLSVFVFERKRIPFLLGDLLCDCRVGHATAGHQVPRIMALCGAAEWLSFLIAILPVVAVLVLLGLLRRPAWQAALAGLIVAMIVAVSAWHMPIGLALNSVLNGAVFALWPVMWIVVNALLLSNIAVRSGRFDAFRTGVERRAGRSYRSAEADRDRRGRCDDRYPRQFLLHTHGPLPALVHRPAKEHLLLALALWLSDDDLEAKTRVRAF